jgi:hypothetical protein
MTHFKYPVMCYTKGCTNPAVYKIAAQWSDGVVKELKTYGLTCVDCLPRWFQQSRKKQAACRLTAGESLDSPGIYRLERGHHDTTLTRLEDLEKQLSATPAS